MKKNSEINNELRIVNYNNGIKLLNPSRHHNPPFNDRKKELTLADLLNQPFCVYLSDTQSAIQVMNEQALITCGFDSLNEAKGKNMFEVATAETAQCVINNQKQVLNSKTLKIVEEDIFKKNGLNFQCITTLFPCYSQDNKVIGILGCTIVFGVHPLAISLSQMTNLGLFNSTATPNQSFLTRLELENIYLSKRETECLTLLANGKKTKEIAAQLKLSSRTVEHYIDNIKNKLGVSTKAELIIKICN